jgi:competence protein ComEC
MRVTLLAVGAGQCAVVEPPGRGAAATLVDAGSTSLSDLLHKCLGPYLRGRGRKQVDTVFISHANYDHFSAAAEVSAAYEVGAVVVGPTFRAQSAGNPPAEDLLGALDALGMPPRTACAGERVSIGPGIDVEVLWPPVAAAGNPAADGMAANDSSLVMRLGFAGRSILFTGDIQEAALAELLKEPAKLKADVLVAPHHGSGEPSTAAFVAAVDPQVILSSNDRTLTLKQRDFESMVGGRRLLRTHQCGAITVWVGRDGALDVEAFLPAAAVSPQRP